MAKPAVDSQTLLDIQKRVESIPGTALAGELQKNAQALVKQPKNAALNFGVGLMYSRLGDFASALKVLERALKLSKGNRIILGVLAYINANQLGDHETAIKYLRKKLLTDKSDVAARLLMANSYMSLGDPEKAIEAINLAEPHAKGEMKNRLFAMRSQCYQRLGKFDEAREELLKLSETDPLGLVSVADVLSRLPNNPPELQEKLETTMVAASDQGSSRFRNNYHQAMTAVAIANIRESRGELVSAFDYFKKANELQGRDDASWSFKETKEFEIIRNVFSKELFSKLPAGHESDRQIFVIGMPRSGTTLLESILGAHDNVEDHGELEFFIEQHHRLGFTAEKHPDVAAHSGLVKKLLLSAPADGFKDIANAYRSRHGFNRAQKMFHVDKMPHNFRSLGIIAAAFPYAKIIHARRHPMDICLSNFKNLLPGYNTTFGQDLETLGKFYLEYSELMRFWHKVLPVNVHDVRYEDLVSDPDSHGQRLVEFCGIEWNPQALENRKKKGDANTASMWQVRQDIYTSSVQKWRAYEDQLATLAEILKDEIKDYESGT